MTNSANAVVYLPNLRRGDFGGTGQVEISAPAGANAGIITYSDVMRDVGKAPTGIEASIPVIEGLAVQLNDSEKGELNGLGVNCPPEVSLAEPVV